MFLATKEEPKTVPSLSGRLPDTSIGHLVADRHIKFPKLSIRKRKVWRFKSQRIIFWEGGSKP